MGGTKAPKKDSGIEVDVKSTHQRYLETVLDPDRKAPVFSESVNPSEAVTSDGYIGTDPIYQNHANATDEPHQADDGPDKLAEDAYIDSVEGEPADAGEALKGHFADLTRSADDSKAKDEVVDEDDDDDEDEVPATPTPSGS